MRIEKDYVVDCGQWNGAHTHHQGHTVSILFLPHIVVRLRFQYHLPAVDT